MLSNTFSQIAANPTAEIQFRRAVLTFEGVKSDAIFAYRPPFNILALVVLLPLKLVLSPRYFHKVNVAIVRFLNAPILLVINLYERRYLWKQPRRRRGGGPTKRSTWRFWSWSHFSVHGDIQAVFDAEPPQALVDEIEATDMLNDDILDHGFHRHHPHHSPPRSEGAWSEIRRRRWSTAEWANSAADGHITWEE